MKNKKFKLFASLTSLVMVVAVMAVGVWAAGASATANISATTSFSASNIGVTITMKANDKVSYNKTSLNDAFTPASQDVEVLNSGINNGGDATGDLFLSLAFTPTNGVIANDATVTVQYTVALSETSAEAGATLSATPKAFEKATDKYNVSAEVTIVDNKTTLDTKDGGDTATITVVYTFEGKGTAGDAHGGETITAENVSIQGVTIVVSRAS